MDEDSPLVSFPAECHCDVVTGNLPAWIPNTIEDYRLWNEYRKRASGCTVCEGSGWFMIRMQRRVFDHLKERGMLYEYVRDIYLAKATGIDVPAARPETEIN